MSYVDRPRDDDAALNIVGDQRCADSDYAESHRYRMRGVSSAFSSVNDRRDEKKKKGGGEKILQAKLQHLVPIIESRA